MKYNAEEEWKKLSWKAKLGGALLVPLFFLVSALVTHLISLVLHSFGIG